MQRQKHIVDPHWIKRRKSIAVFLMMAILFPGALCSRAGGERKAPEIQFSHPSGFYDQPFDLEMSSSADGDICYTLDGSTPDPLNPNTFRYSGSLHIEGNRQLISV